MKFNTLYGKSGSGNLLVWEISSEGDSFTVRYGVLGGKIQEKTTVCKEKFVGKANYRSATNQALSEAEARWVKQKKKGYYETKEEALEHQEVFPMKLTSWGDQSHKIVYPCYLQRKLDGNRYLVCNDGSGLSKQGEKIFLPEHIQKDVASIKAALGSRFKGLDGEIYAGLVAEGGLSLQRIVSAFRKHGSDTDKLKLYVYDIPNSTEVFSQRLQSLKEIETIIQSKGIKNVVVVETEYVASKEEAEKKALQYHLEGYEGGVARNRRGGYEFGRRSYDSQKIKFRKTTEARVVSVEKDKNEQGLLLCELENGLEFKCLMRKDSSLDVNLRLYDNALSLIGMWIEVEFEDYSDLGNLQKPVGLRVREVNKITWEAKDSV